MIAALLLSAVRAAELTRERGGRFYLPSPEVTAGLLLQTFGSRLALVHGERVVELLKAASEETKMRIVR